MFQNMKMITLYVWEKKKVDSSRSKNSYWDSLKILWNGMKVPDIPHLLVSNELITNFETKANIFNTYFGRQCTTVNNESTRPSFLYYLTDDRLCSFSIFSEIIFQLIRSLKHTDRTRFPQKLDNYVTLQHANRLL